MWPLNPALLESATLISLSLNSTCLLFVLKRLKVDIAQNLYIYLGSCFVSFCSLVNIVSNP